MNYRKTLKYFLVHNLKISNQASEKLIYSSEILINGEICNTNCIVSEEDEIRMNTKILQPAKILQYFIYHKPVGIECTLNPKIKNNLSSASGLPSSFFPVGRLDKDSEGLVLMTNDGNLYKHITWPFQKIEKEYLVTVDKVIDETKLKTLESGIQIENFKTQACKIRIENNNKFTIILKEGKNRQIRKMCATIGYEVVQLLRLRIDIFKLGDLPCGKSREVTKEELTNLRN